MRKIIIIFIILKKNIKNFIFYKFFTHDNSYQLTLRKNTIKLEAIISISH